MNLFRVLAVARKETWHLVRDTRSLYLALGIPVMLLTLFGYALSLDVDDIPLAVWDQARTPQSREFIDRLTSSGYFRLVLYADSHKQIVRAIDRRKITVGVAIPRELNRDVYKPKGATVQAIVDASDSSRAGIAIGLVKEHGVALAEAARRVGVSTSAISKIVKQKKSLVK